MLLRQESCRYLEHSLQLGSDYNVCASSPAYMLLVMPVSERQNGPLARRRTVPSIMPSSPSSIEFWRRLIGARPLLAEVLTRDRERLA